MDIRVDDIVVRGMAKWPNVPAVYGWLALDRRARWLLKGDHITNPAVTAFICRNYLHDERGRWFFQNGPQRVFVDLEYTPLIYRVVAGGSAELELEAHTGQRATALTGAWLDDEGALIVATQHGPGIVHDRDVAELSASFVATDGHALNDDELETCLQALQKGRDAHLELKACGASTKILPIARAQVEKHFGFEAHPKES